MAFERGPSLYKSSLVFVWFRPICVIWWSVQEGGVSGAPQRRCQLFYGLGGVVLGVHKLAGLLCAEPS